MMGIALARCEVPDELVDRLSNRVTHRGDGEPEVQFLYRQRPRVLPVWHYGRLVIMPWAGWCPLEELESRAWSERRPKQADIPATYCVDRGIWYQVKEGIRGVIVQNQVYPITQPASHYYRVMTRSERMPLLIGESF